jgi:hypothetical protein
MIDAALSVLVLGVCVIAVGADLGALATWLRRWHG